jgi:hypothetical protein
LIEADRPIGERMLEYFFRSVTSLIRRSSDLNDSVNAMQVVMAATESARTGQRQQL